MADKVTKVKAKSTESKAIISLCLSLSKISQNEMKKNKEGALYI